MDTQIAIYGKRSCLELCRAMATRFPRELRNLVYEHLTANSSPISVDDDHITYEQSGCYGFTHSDFLSKQLFAYPAFVGRENCQEILEIYLQKNTFCLNDSYRLGGFFRTAKPFVMVPGAPLLAPIDFVRNLIIKIRGDVLKPLMLPSLSDLENANFDHALWLNPRKIPRPSDKLFDSLQPLFLIKHPKGFWLQLAILANSREELEGILEGMRPIYSRLKDTGFKVEVTFGAVEKIHYVEHLTGFFECSREDWDAIIEAYFVAEPDLAIEDIADPGTRYLVSNAREQFPGWSVRYLLQYTQEEPAMFSGFYDDDSDIDEMERNWNEAFLPSTFGSNTM
ncbi:hypothetical protein K505DRAFT_81198 [Melanomma pulvis-pyrius CBS 109.77]|uniref:Uncharacterized protein n=1 Tax=Melanomma pulvis-pyrius CBS 109.77 TaxID=1314802 RepID=A0A6A6X2H5_9PLEO|nr:hypothetical protein K505DRAFT_81198 [Melanomma pulvis-pyrius CBS 109.77]